jgi:phosphoglycerate kinase
MERTIRRVLENFAHGTIALGNFIAESTANGAFSLVGGGDSVAVKQFGLEDKMSYVLRGGAMLEMLEGALYRNCCYFRLIRAKTKI